MEHPDHVLAVEAVFQGTVRRISEGASAGSETLLPDLDGEQQGYLLFSADLTTTSRLKRLARPGALRRCGPHFHAHHLGRWHEPLAYRSCRSIGSSPVPHSARERWVSDYNQHH